MNWTPGTGLFVQVGTALGVMIFFGPVRNTPQGGNRLRLAGISIVDIPAAVVSFGRPDGTKFKTPQLSKPYGSLSNTCETVGSTFSIKISKKKWSLILDAILGSELYSSLAEAR